MVEDGRMLVVQRANEPGAGRWAVPGGVVVAGETMRDAVRRELGEELALDVDPGAVAWVGEIIDDQHHYVIVDFFAHVVGGTLRPDPAEVTEARWVPIRDLTDLPLVPTMHALIETIWPEL